MIGSILNLLTGLWLMFSPALLNYDKPAAFNDYIAGPLIISFSIISFSEVTRSVNKWNIVSGAWLIFSPLILWNDQTAFIINHILCGLLLILFSLLTRKVKKSFGGGWSSLREK